MTAEPSQRVALVGDYLPRECGIATFTHDVCHWLGRLPGTNCSVVAVHDLPDGYAYPSEVRFALAEADLPGYQRAANFLNLANPDVVCVQHEFGIYGGPAGSHLLSLLRRLRIPVVVQLHSILAEPSAAEMRVMRELVRLSTRLIVMSQRGKRMLQEIYQAPGGRVDVIPHGIPDMSFVDPSFYKDEFGVEGKRVLLTFGLLSPGKGIEFVIRALPALVSRFPEVVYLVVGATHPKLLREQGEAYRHRLEQLAVELGVREQVIFHNRFVELQELERFLGAADVYITPYLNPAQITSGTLAYAFGCGKAVVSTPYWHAEELLNGGRGVLVPFRDSAAIARELGDLLGDEVRRQAMRKQAYLLGREMVWERVSHLFAASFEKARRARVESVPAPLMLRGLETAWEWPKCRLDHLKKLSDSIGLFQHAKHSLIDFREGYCTDDNSRALLLAVVLEGTEEDQAELQRLASTYAAFLNHAFVPERRRFHNFLGFDRCWRDEDGSDDCQGRALLALAACVSRSRREDLRRWAAELFDRALPAAVSMTSPRGWALVLTALHEYCREFSGDRAASLLRETLSRRLLESFQSHRSADWVWFEDELTYGNAMLSHGLLVSGSEEGIAIGSRSMRWLMEVQTGDGGHFQPVGSRGFFPRGGRRADFDQQPLEAGVSAAACLAAWRATGEESWRSEARRAFEWFLGRNDLGETLYDAGSGSCYDGLHVDRVNRNQGAESTLSALLALQEMKLAGCGPAFRHAGEPVDLPLPTGLGGLAGPAGILVTPAEGEGSRHRIPRKRQR